MRRRKRGLMMFALLILLTSCAHLGSTIMDAGAEADEADAAGGQGYNLTGYWTGTLSGSLVSGPCLPMRTQTGDVLIEQLGNSFMMEFGEGFDCDPVEACEYAGEMGENGNLFGTNTGFTSNGGIYSSSVELDPVADGSQVHGFGSSSYIDPEGEYECEWETELLLVPRTPEPEQIPTE